MKLYEEPYVEIVMLDVEDVIATSCIGQEDITTPEIPI